MSERIRKDSNDRKTVAGALDFSTAKTIYKLIERKEIDAIEGIIEEGKESVIILATKDGEKRLIKAYKINASKFNNMKKYIIGDVRFRGVKSTKRAIVYAWCKKEFSNLARAKKAGVTVPEPYAFLNNILVLEHIGTDDIAPPLNKAHINDPKKVFDTIIKETKKLYKDAGLVHADLSQFNILMDEGKVVLIDFGQATLPTHPRAKEFLERDVRNICNYFSKLGVKCDEKKVLEKITG